MISWLVKKYVLSIVNDALNAVKDKEKANVWKERIQKALNLLQTFMKALEDNQISSEEADKLYEETKKLIG